VTNTAIDPNLPRSLEDASTQLIDRIRQAIRDFRAAPPDGSDVWESWRTPQPWETRVLSNLERYHRHLKEAIAAYDAGDIKPITHEASSYAGLAKDLDFDMRWMTEPNRSAFEEALDRVVMVADRIHRLGYDELARTGRM
jgi:hypothetical protein